MDRDSHVVILEKESHEPKPQTVEKTIKVITEFIISETLPLSWPRLPKIHEQDGYRRRRFVDLVSRRLFQGRTILVGAGQPEHSAAPATNAYAYYGQGTSLAPPPGAAGGAAEGTRQGSFG